MTEIKKRPNLSKFAVTENGFDHGLPDSRASTCSHRGHQTNSCTYVLRKNILKFRVQLIVTTATNLT
jgi:hypothetical protein